MDSYEKFALKLADANTGMIMLTNCKGYLTNSGLDSDSIKRIVRLANPNAEESITKSEFILMLH